MTRTGVILGLLLTLAGCRTNGGGGPIFDTDSGTTDDMTVTPPTDNGTNPPEDRGTTPRDVGACEASAGGRENSNRECTDGVDNDCNGFIDCEDFGCRNCGVSACVRDGGVTQRDGGFCMCATERNATACSDGNDNDCDGFVDCMDNDCVNCAVPVCLRDGGIPFADGGSCTCGSENTPAACSDGRDNDCDGFIDCGGSGTNADFDCPCSDGGARDAGSCTPSGAENTVAACSDGMDNDCNGYSDCVDRACSCVGTCAAYRMGCTCMGAENTNATCMDGRDNDCDGFTDCGSTPSNGDFDCTRNSAVTACGATDAGARD